MQLNQDVNIENILKKCPLGTTLYSPILGECTFVGTDPIKVKAHNGNSYTFTPYGKYILFGVKDTECVLFPSKENRDWNKFGQSLLAQYSTETLRDELKRRNAEEKARRQKEFDNAHRCRNCKYFEKEPHTIFNSYICMARTWGKTIKRHYVVNGSNGLKCDKFIHK